MILFAAACTTTLDDPACPTIELQAQQLMTTLKSCRADDDCVLADTTMCGLPERCAVPISAGAKPQLDNLVRQWTAECSISASYCSACAAHATAARCVDGQCACVGEGC